jgi:hypothetical protein
VILHRLTPWAAQQLKPETREAIEAAEPRDLLVTLGRGAGGWTCRILSPRQAGVLGESYHAGTIESAYRRALEDALAKSDTDLLEALR